MENGEGRIHIREEKLDAVFNHVIREEPGRGRESRTTWRTVDAVQSIRDFRRESTLSLCLPKFADHFCSRAFRSLLLRYRVVGARELSRGAVSTRVDAVAFHLSTMAGIAGPFDRRRHHEHGFSMNRHWLVDHKCNGWNVVSLLTVVRRTG